MRSPVSFTKEFCAWFVLTGLTVFAFIVVVDPYMNIGLVDIQGRAPVSQNQRFAYPAIARDPAFNSVIIGTSTSRLLDPAALNTESRRFANLSLNSGTVYEQERTLRLFLRHHQHVVAAVFGVDGTWCQAEEGIQKLTFRTFPQWMYDDNRWNDFLYMFNDKAFENAVRMVQVLRGERTAKYRRDGYRDFTVDFGAWDAGQVRKRLYRDSQHKIQAYRVRPRRKLEEFAFPQIDVLGELVESLPAETRVLLILPPLHKTFISRTRREMARCKGALLNKFENDERVQVLDYLYTSEVTVRDENFWDQLHFTRSVASDIERDVVATLAHDPASFRYRRVSEEMGVRRASGATRPDQ